MKIRRSIASDEGGATAIEFAIVASVFFMLMFGIIEYGLIMFTKVALESALLESSRSASIGTATGACDRVCTIKNLVHDKTLGLISPKSVVVSATVVTNATTASPRIPDICLDSPNIPYPATCAKWQDNGGDPFVYEPPGALGAASIGVAGDLVEIRVTYLWRVIFPIFQSYFGKNGVLTISTSTVVKNEPF